MRKDSQWTNDEHSGSVWNKGEEGKRQWEGEAREKKERGGEGGRDCERSSPSHPSLPLQICWPRCWPVTTCVPDGHWVREGWNWEEGGERMNKEKEEEEEEEEEDFMRLRRKSNRH